MGADFENDYPYTFLKIVTEKECKFYLDLQKYLDINVFDLIDVDALLEKYSFELPVFDEMQE